MNSRVVRSINFYQNLIDFGDIYHGPLDKKCAKAKFNFLTSAIFAFIIHSIIALRLFENVILPQNLKFNFEFWQKHLGNKNLIIFATFGHPGNNIDKYLPT